MVDPFQHRQGLSCRYSQKTELENMCWAASSVLLTRQPLVFKKRFPVLVQFSLKCSERQLLQPSGRGSRAEELSRSDRHAKPGSFFSYSSFHTYCGPVRYLRTETIFVLVTFSCAARAALGNLDINTDETKRA